MSTRTTERRTWLRWGLGILSLAFATTVHAEFGVVVNSGVTPSNPAAPYIIQSIVEDIDPFGYVWQRYNVDSATRYVLNPEGFTNGDGPPAFVRVPDTTDILVLWARNSPDGFDIVSSRFDGTGWSTPEPVVASSSDELDPSLAVDPATGTVHLAYWVDGTTPEVRHREWTEATGWSAPTVVSQSGEASCLPDLVMHDGDLRVTYEVHDYGYQQTPRQVVLARKVGPQFVPEVVAITQNDGRVRPRVHSKAGRLWVDWIESDQDMAWSRLEADGSGWEPIRYQPYADQEDLEYLVQGAIRMQAIAP